MPKKFTPKPPLEKLSLAVRKDFRDNFENNRTAWETQAASTLGAPLTIKFDVNAVWAYYDGTNTDAGSMLGRYVEGFLDAAKRFVDVYDVIGTEYFKNAVHKGELILAVNERGDDAEYIGADVRDGVFRILFKHDSFGSNQSYLYDEFVKAIDRAPHEHSPFNLRAKHSIAVSYKDEIDDVRAEIGTILNLPDVVLEPNFEKNYAALKEKEGDWQESFGRASLEYFRDGFKYQLERQGFKGDDMLQEGFVDGVPSKKIVIRVVEKTNNGSYNEVVIEDGVAYLQTTPSNWWCNVSDVASGLMDLL